MPPHIAMLCDVCIVCLFALLFSYFSLAFSLCLVLFLFITLTIKIFWRLFMTLIPLITNVNVFSCILPDYEFNYDLPKSGIVGGVGVFTHKSLKIKIRNDLYIKSTSNNTIENIWMVVSKSNKKFVIGCLYRHPNSFISEFCQLKDISMSKLDKSKHPCICLGDTNVDVLKFNVSSAVREI